MEEFPKRMRDWLYLIMEELVSDPQNLTGRQTWGSKTWVSCVKSRVRVWVTPELCFSNFNFKKFEPEKIGWVVKVTPCPFNPSTAPGLPAPEAFWSRPLDLPM